MSSSGQMCIPSSPLEDSVIYAVTWAGISILQEISLLRSTTRAFVYANQVLASFFISIQIAAIYLWVVAGSIISGSRCRKLTGSLIKIAFYYWGAPSVHSARARGGGAVSFKHCPVNFQQVGIQLEGQKHGATLLYSYVFPLIAGRVWY